MNKYLFVTNRKLKAANKYLLLANRKLKSANSFFFVEIRDKKPLPHNPEALVNIP